MLEAPLRQEKRLHEHLGCCPTSDYVVAIFSARNADALVTEHWGFARREAEGLSAGLIGNEPSADLPADHHDLNREGRYAWVHPEQRGHRIAIGRLFRASEFSYDDQPLTLNAVLGLGGAPILFVATATEEVGQLQTSQIRSVLNGVAVARTFPVEDFRGVYPRSQDPSLRQFGESLIHPILPVPATVEHRLPATQ